jgi:hypothetical protein
LRFSCSIPTMPNVDRRIGVAERADSDKSQTMRS